jgi:hypothetical protein
LRLWLGAAARMLSLLAALLAVKEKGKVNNLRLRLLAS